MNQEVQRTALGYAGIVLMMLTAFMTATVVIALFGSNAPLTSILLVLVVATLFFMLSAFMINEGHEKKKYKI